MEEADWLTQAAKDRGVDITRRQLADWHRAGLLPTPTIQWLGRGRGSRAWYPPGTLIQALACNTHLSRNNDHKLVGWLLWIDGFVVAEPLWKVHFERARLLFVSINQAAEADSFEEELRNIVTASKASTMKLLRRRLRQGRLVVTHKVLAVVSGAFFHSGAGGEEEEYQQTLFARAVGLIPPAKKRSIRVENVEELSGNDLAIRLSDFADFVPLILEDNFLIRETASFREARDELKAMIVAFHRKVAGRRLSFAQPVLRMLASRRPTMHATAILIIMAKRDALAVADETASEQSTAQS